MSLPEFNTTKLWQLAGVDARTALRNFDSPGEYFAQLFGFTEAAGTYLRKHDAHAIIGSDNARGEFLAEAESIKSTLTALGVTSPLNTLSGLIREAGGVDVAALAKGLETFYAETESAAKKVLAAQMEGGAESPAGTGSSRPVILAVDDKPELLTAIVNMLDGSFRVMAVTNGKTVLKLIERHKPDLFLLDIEMPEMNGYELAEQIRRIEKYKETPIIFLTARNTREDIISAIQRGGNDYILKPVNRELLVAKITRHLEGQ